MQQQDPIGDSEGRLNDVVGSMNDAVALAVSGGIDSLTLASFLHLKLGAKVTMFHAVSPAVPIEATARVTRLAAEQDWNLRIIDAGEFLDPDYRANPVNRCFFCKMNLYGAIARHTDAQILSGTNLDDLGEFRPGLEAARNIGVRHPFLEASVTKSEIRGLARRIGLGDLSDLPAAPCLSSRVETGLPIRPEILQAVHLVERSLARTFPQGIIRCRVRAGGVVVELDPATLAQIRGAEGEASVRAEVSACFEDKDAGERLLFEPYRNGSAFLRGNV